MINGDLKIKNLFYLGKDLQNVILVDSHISSYCCHPDNGIYVPYFKGESSDSELLKLGQFLCSIKDKCLIKALQLGGHNLATQIKQIIE